jgi:hypothetical protein
MLERERSPARDERSTNFEYFNAKRITKTKSKYEEERLTKFRIRVPVMEAAEAFWYLVQKVGGLFIYNIFKTMCMAN